MLLRKIYEETTCLSIVPCAGAVYDRLRRSGNRSKHHRAGKHTSCYTGTYTRSYAGGHTDTYSQAYPGSNTQAYPGAHARSYTCSYTGTYAGKYACSFCIFLCGPFH